MCLSWIHRKPECAIYILGKSNDGLVGQREDQLASRSEIRCLLYTLTFDTLRSFVNTSRTRMSRKSGSYEEQPSVDVEPERILVHKLVDSSKAQRTKAVERLRAWINARTLNPTSFFSYDDLIKVWKGLYYNMWMADKPVLQVSRHRHHFRACLSVNRLVKDQLALQVSSFIHEFRDSDQARLFIDAGFATFAREWWGIDRWRLSKFMTVRAFAQSLLRCTACLSV